MLKGEHAAEELRRTITRNGAIYFLFLSKFRLSLSLSLARSLARSHTRAVLIQAQCRENESVPRFFHSLLKAAELQGTWSSRAMLTPGGVKGRDSVLIGQRMQVLVELSIMQFGFHRTVSEEVWNRRVQDASFFPRDKGFRGKIAARDSPEYPAKRENCSGELGHVTSDRRRSGA